MAAKRNTGLDSDQLERVRGEVAAGRRPRVQISAAQFPAGTTGSVLRVGDPGVDGEDYVTVRVKVGGVVDELGFSPAELAVASRRRAKSTAAASPSATRSAAPQAPLPTSPTPSSQAPGGQAPGSPAPSSPAPSSQAPGSQAPSSPTPSTPAPQNRASSNAPAPRRPKRTRSAAGDAAATPSPRAATATPGAVKPAGAASPPRPARRAAPPATVTISIASEGSSWSVSASRGARALVKKTGVPPGVVAAAVALLGQPDLDEAVAAVNDTARVEAEARAERLRAELAEVEAVLSSHRRP